MIAVPPFDDLFYCYEMGEDNNTPHTHIGLKTSEKMSKNEILEYLKNTMDDQQEPDVKVHRSFDSIIGYHYGLGDKEKCEPEPAWISRDFNFNEYIKNKVCHKSNNTKTVKLENKILIETNNKELVDNGLIKLINLPKIVQAKELYGKYVEDTRGSIPPLLPNTWNEVLPVDLSTKRCHYWIYSKGFNKGKTTHRKQWAAAYRFQINPYSEKRWEQPPEPTEGIIFDPYNGKETRLPHDLLEGLCDGDGFRMNIKYGGLYNLTRKLLIIVFCNDSLIEAYPNKASMLSERFNEICLD